MKPIIIEGALYSEIDYIIKKINATEKEINSFKFYEGSYNGYPIVVCKTKMSEINSSIATTLSILKYDPLLIINQGTAGAYDPDLNVGDIVIGTDFYYISNYSTKNNKELDDVNPWKKEKYLTKDNESIAYCISESLKLYLQNILRDKNIHFGTICSGDIWYNTKEEITENRSRFNGLCETMEVAGSYMAANSFNCPIFSARIIANNYFKNEAYDESKGQEIQKFILKLLDRLIEDLNNKLLN